MAKRVFDLSGASDEEAEAIREILQQNGVEYYETPPLNFGLNAAAIWVANEGSYREARQLIEEIQLQYAAMAKDNQKEKKITVKKLLPFVFLAVVIVLSMLAVAASFF